jgi:WD40 repeat protein
VLQTLHAGPGAMGVSMNRAKTLALVAASGEGAVYVYTIADRRLTQVGKIDLGPKSEPRDVIFAPDGRNAYVVGWGNGKLTKLAINGAKVTVVTDIMTGVDPKGQAVNNIDGADISRDGRYLYNTAFSGTPMSPTRTGTVAVTDLRSFKLVASTEVGDGPENLILSSDGKYMAVTILNGTASVRSAPNFNTVLGKLKLYAVNGPKLTFVGEADTGHNCQGAVFSEDNKTVLLQCATEKEIELFRFDGKSLTRDMGATLVFDARPGAIATNKTR